MRDGELLVLRYCCAQVLLRARLAWCRVAVALYAVLIVSVPQAEPLCLSPEAPCRINGGEYLARAPANWDGRSPLAVLVHFHGFRESAAEIMAREDIRAITDAAGLLFVVPQGAGQSWSHPGSPTQLRDEFAFIEAILADVRFRWPVQTNRLWASGFSQGASMVWNVACHRGELFSAYLPISGAFWRPEPPECAYGRRNIRHIHGLSDRTVPLEGRAIRGGAFHQGDVFRAMSLMRRINACEQGESRTIRRGALVCEEIAGCGSGGHIEMCLHSGGHDFDPSWLAAGWEWVKNLPAVSAFGSDRR